MKKFIFITLLLIAILCTACNTPQLPPSDTTDNNDNTTAIDVTTEVLESTTGIEDTTAADVTTDKPDETTEATETTTAPIDIILDAPVTLDEALTKLTLFQEEAQELSDYINQLILEGYDLGDPSLYAAQKAHFEAQYAYGFYLSYWNAWSQEFPVACQIWQFLRQTCGYSEAVSAGILGNMMIECSDKNLDLSWNIYNKAQTHYGICQWSKEYYPEIQLASLEAQLDFLASTIEYEINTFADNYKKSFSYNEFLKITQETDAALAFAKCYERCGTGSYADRQACATTALDYFTKQMYYG